MLSSSPFLVTAHKPEFSLQTFKYSRRCRFVFPGCTLFFYEGDGRSGIDHNSVPKHAVWVENSIVQAVPEHPKKDFVFCLSNSLGDAFLFQVCGPPLQSASRCWSDSFPSSLWISSCFPLGGRSWLLHIIEAIVLLLLFNCSVVSNSLPPHGLQHARPPCPSRSPRVCSCLLSCHNEWQNKHLCWVAGMIELT